MNSFTVDNIKDFNLDHIFDCGQCFRWNKEPNGSYTGIAMGRKVNMQFTAGLDSESSREAAGALTITPCTEQEFREIWRPYLDLDRDYGKIKETLCADDPIMRKAADFGYGIRLLDQDLWETIVSFIISQNNNIPRIKGCIERLCAAAGEPISGGAEDGDAGNFGDPGRAAAGAKDGDAGNSGDPGRAAAGAKDGDAGNSGNPGRAAAGAIRSEAPAYEIPGPEALARLGEADLAEVRLGYRSRYLMETARSVCEQGLPENEEQLLELCGIGPRVANCILLFGMKKYDSFPIDVWVRRVMHELYGLDENNKKQMAAFAREKFGDLGGFAQQYLFYYMRSIAE